MSLDHLCSFAERLRQLISHTTPAVERESLTRDRHLDDFNSLALELFELQFEHNPTYRRLCVNQGVSPQDLSSWKQVPFVPTSAFKEVEMSCIPAGQRTAVFHSSGTTTNRPSRHFHSQASLALYEESLWHWFKPHLIPEWSPGRPTWDLVSLTPAPELAPHSSLVHMFATIANQLGGGINKSEVRSPKSEEAARSDIGAPAVVFCSSVAEDGRWELGFQKALEFLSNTKRPVLLAGTAFLFVHLLDGLGKRELHLPRGSRVLETGGYKGRSRELEKTELHGWMQRVFGIPAEHIICEYGMSELSSQAYDLDIDPAFGLQSSSLKSQPLRTRCFHFPPWARAQVISPETGWEVEDGETGLIRICDLANVYSVLAIQTEDLGVRCGDGFQIIGRAAATEPRGCSLMSA